MGTWVEITIGKHGYLTCQNLLSPLLLIFSPEDRRIEKFMEGDEECTSYKFITTVNCAKQCLDVAGYRVPLLESKFEMIKSDMEYIFENI